LTQQPGVPEERPVALGRSPVEIRAYAADCRIAGRMVLEADRLTDLLNGTQELVIREVRLESLEDGHMVEVTEITVSRDELLAVVAPEPPRGNPSRRLRTHSTPVEADAGPYHVRGWIHGTAAADPLGAVVRRLAWLPLTDATVRYRIGGEEATEDVGILVVNRALMGSMQSVEEEPVLLPWERARAAPSVRQRTMDLTGSLRDPSRTDDPDARPPAPPAPEPPV